MQTQEFLKNYCDTITASQYRTIEVIQNYNEIRSIWFSTTTGRLFYCDERSGDIKEICRDGQIAIEKRCDEAV